MLLLFLSAAAAQPTGRAPSIAVQTAIRRYWDTELVDAPATRWRWPLQRDPTLYCGWMNTKNRAGGYAGWIPYVVTLTGGRVTEGYFLPERPELAKAMGANCVAAGYDVERPPQ